MLLSFFTERVSNMSWDLFCQIEIIILTIGLVAVFIISKNCAYKDESFFRKVSAFGKVLGDYGNKISEMKTKSQKEMMEAFLKTIKNKKEGDSDNDN